jgi:acylphosphatase
MTKIKSIQIHITGRVQNVGFRFNAQDTALKLGLNGFVMNKPDGSVYIEVEGAEDAINRFLIWCHQGPDWARVTGVNMVEQDIRGYEGFYIKK